jgi:hypothetical protein
MTSRIPAQVDRRESDTREGRQLEYFTLGWNLTEAVIGIGAGVIAGSIALYWFRRGFNYRKFFRCDPALAIATSQG